MKPSKPEKPLDKLSRLELRCKAHQKDQRGRARKKGNATKQTTHQKPRSTTEATSNQTTASKDTSKPKKVPQNANTEQTKPIISPNTTNQALKTKITPWTTKEKANQDSSKDAIRISEHDPNTSTSTSKRKDGIIEDGKKDGLASPGPLTVPGWSANKMTEEQREHVYQMIASGYGTPTILKYIKRFFGIKVSRQNINQMQHKHPEAIARGREQVGKQISLAAPLASQLNRIAKRQELIESLTRYLWRVTSQTKKGAAVLTGAHSTINNILDSIQRELEPYEVNLTHGLQEQTAAQFKDLDDKSVINQAMQQLKDRGMEIAVIEPPEEQS